MPFKAIKRPYKVIQGHTSTHANSNEAKHSHGREKRYEENTKFCNVKP